MARRALLYLATAALLFLPPAAAAQTLTGTLIATVRDAQGAIVQSARATLSSPALIGGRWAQTTNDQGQLRFFALPPGWYVLEIESPGLTTYHEEAIRIGAAATIERIVEMTIAGIAESVTVEEAGPGIDAREPGIVTRFGPDAIESTPTRRSSMFDFVRATPGVSPTSPSSGAATTVSVLGSGTNENQFLIDGTNTTCPCNGAARAEPGIDFIEEIQVQSIGASAEFGNMQGGVINVVTRQGSERFTFDGAYFGQTAALTSESSRLPYARTETGYQRVRYRDLTTSAGGPAIRDRLWFFGGYQYLRDYDSQPGTGAEFPRTYEQDKILAKLTWKLTPGLRLLQSYHQEFWVNPDPPTLATPFEATRRRSATVPAITFGHLTHVLSGNTVWDLRAGRFFYSEDRDPATGDPTIPSRLDRVTGVTTGAPPQFGGITLSRTSVKATFTGFRSAFGSDHQFKIGSEVEKGEQHGANVIPTGVRYEDRNGPYLAIASEASNTGGSFLTGAVFASDALTINDRLTITAGLRFDRSRAVSQDLHALDASGQETDERVPGLGTLYTWNELSPRLGITTKLAADGRVMLRASFGRFSQGVQTGEYSGFHPGVTPVTTFEFDPATGGYTRLVRKVDARVNLLLDGDLRPPHTNELSLALDREIGRHAAVSIAFVNKQGTDFIGWTDVGGNYVQTTRTLPDGRVLPVWNLVNSTAEQRFLLTNPAGYRSAYHGLVVAIDRRHYRGWRASGSYTFSKTEGLIASSGETAAGAQSSTVAAPTRVFGRDPNDLTNAYGRLPNDRPHVFRALAAFDVPKTHLMVAANFQHFSGKPWAATAQVDLNQGPQRIQLETRGARRLDAQSLLDVRISRSFYAGGGRRIELLVDILNTLNDAAAEGLVTDNEFSPNFGQPSIFMDPRRAMIGARVHFGR